MDTLDVASHLRLVRGRHGWTLVNLNDVYVGQAVARYGEYGRHELGLLLQLVRRYGSVVEVGANIGTLTVPLAHALAAAGRRLIAFEPQPAVFQNLCANLALAGLLNVQALPFACGEQAGVVFFQPPDYRRRGNFGGVEMRTAAAAGTQAVRCVRLDDELAGEAVGLVKLDVEGFELAVLKGAATTLQRCRPALYLENDRVDRSAELIEWLWAADYRLWWHIPHLFDPDNFAGERENLYGQIASFNVLALPREQPADVRGLAEVTDSAAHPLRSVG